MNVYHANYFVSGSYGYFENIDVVLVANTEKEGLGICLEKYSETESKYWSLEKIDLAKAGLTEIDVSYS